MADTTITSIIFVGFRYVTKGFVRLGYVRFSSVRLRLVSFGLVLFSFGFVIRRQSIMKPNLWNSEPASARSALAVVAFCSEDFKLHSDTSSIVPSQLVIELHAVFSTLDDFLQLDKWRSLRSNAFASNSVSNREKLLQRLFRWLMERIVCAVRNVTSDISVSNRAERPSKTTLNMDSLPHQWTTITLRK